MVLRPVTYYDMNGTPISLHRWAALFEEGNRLAVTTFEDGLFVSTVWLGIDHSVGVGGPPLIFETMVFGPTPESNVHEYDQQRYSTKEQALAGHWQMVALVSVRHGEPLSTELREVEG